MKSLAEWVSSRSRSRRAGVLFNYVQPQEDWRILDLGGGSGEHIETVFPNHRNIVVCDYSSDELGMARKRGFETVLADGSERLPFRDQEFDFVFCSSVIEHVTGPKSQVVSIKSDDVFKEMAWQHQTKFANEIRRVGKRFYVQTPHKYFLIESHSWLPMLIVLLDRRSQISVIDFTNKVWPKKTAPDWNLLVCQQMRSLFPEAEIVIEKSMGFPKSIMAIRGCMESKPHG